MDSIPFIAGQTPNQPSPLEEYLPQVSPSTLTIWLERAYPHPNLILDPFGSSPQSLLTAARGGYRVLAAINNPITRFLVTYAARAPSSSDLTSALATLASTFKGEERLEPHILSLYETDCPHCGKKISAQAFIWKAKGTAPDQKVCHCSQCHNQGVYPTSEEDVEKAQEHKENSLYYARALTRIAPPDDPIRSHAEKALQLYKPRAVYALFTLINKFSGLSLSAEESSHISALLLHAFYKANNLWPHPPEKKAALKLSSLATHRENNVWRALEEAVDVWDREEQPVKVTRWPDLPSVEGGISVYPGRFRDLAEKIKETFGAAVMVVPQPSPAFWSLSALWAGWLWGQETAAPLRNILSLQKTDWGWHTRALQNTFANLQSFLTYQTSCFAVLPDVSPEFLTSAITASHASRFQIQSISLENFRGEAQIVWSRREESERFPPESLKAVLRNAGYSHLSERGEPSYTLPLYAAGLRAVDQEGAFYAPGEVEISQIYAELREEMEETFAYRQGFLHYPDSDTWWHQESSLDVTPLSDELEKKLVNRLVNADTPLQRLTLENEIYTHYPGLLTPPAKLIEVCLKSYAEKVEEGTDRWQLKENETPSTRLDDIQEMEGLLGSLGERLGFSINRKSSRGHVSVFTWDDDEGPAHTFFISASGILGKLILLDPDPPPDPWIVLPGSRAHLVVYKLSQNIPLRERVEESWGFLKYRHLRRLVDDESVTRENLGERLSLDPLQYDAPQLPLI